MNSSTGSIKNHSHTFISEPIVRKIGPITLALILSLNLVVSAQSSNEVLIEVDVFLTVKEKLTLSSEVDGVIRKIEFDAGDQVSKGQRLLTIASEEKQLELDKARYECAALRIRAEDRSAIEAAEAQLRSAQRHWNEVQRALKKTRFPAVEIERVKSAFGEADANLEGARASLAEAGENFRAKELEVKLLERQLKKHVIHSRFEGQVLDKLLYEGEYVEKSKPIATLYRLDLLSGIVWLDQRSISHTAALTSKLKLKLDGYGAEEFRILRFSPKIDVDQRYQAYFEIRNRKGADNQWLLLPGMSSKGTVSVFEEITP